MVTTRTLGVWTFTLLNIVRNFLTGYALVIHFSLYHNSPYLQRLKGKSPNSVAFLTTVKLVVPARLTCAQSSQQ